MKLIVGLGNPGPEYASTRHNVGFMAIDALAAKLALDFSKEKHFALTAEGRYAGEKIMLMKPQTFMNLSGKAVADAVNFYHLEQDDVLVIFDDMDLPCGQLKVRQKGSGGGHNGVGDIIKCLGSDQISRFKIGIDHPVYGTVVDYVLQSFSQDEQELIKPTINLSVDAALCWLENGTKETMSVYNGFGKPNSKKAKTSEDTIKQTEG